jgi:hypothetical protein
VTLAEVVAAAPVTEILPAKFCMLNEVIKALFGFPVLKVSIPENNGVTALEKLVGPEIDN